MSFNAPPAFSATSSPSPTAPGWLVEIKPFSEGSSLATRSLFLAKPPVAKITASAFTQ